MTSRKMLGHGKMTYHVKSALLNLKIAQLSHGVKYVCQEHNKAGMHHCAAVCTVTGL